MKFFLSIIIFFNLIINLSEAETELCTNSIMQQKLINLHEQGNFVFLDVLTFDEINLMSNLSISTTEQYINKGNLNNLSEEITEFISSIGSNDRELSKKISYILQNIISNLLDVSGKESGYVILRAFTPTDEFDLPRWHTDGAFFSHHDLEYKFVLPLKGPPTLFCLPNKELRNQVLSINQNDTKSRANLLKNEIVFTSNPGQGVFFIVGDSKVEPAMHSEPKIDEARLFFSFVPANFEQIEARKAFEKWVGNGKISEILNYEPQNEIEQKEYDLIVKFLNLQENTIYSN